MTDDRQALKLLKAGDPAGFELAYDHYRQPIYAFLLRMSGRRDVADDLFQETWIKVARAAHRLRPDSELGAWLFTVARNVFHSFLRRERGYDAEPIADAVAAPDSDMTLDWSDLERGLLSLSVDDRELLLLVGVHGLDHEALASLLELEPAAVRQRLSRARARLARSLELEPRSQRVRSQR